MARLIMILSMVIFASCSVTSRFQRNSTTVKLSQLNKVEREILQESAAPRLTIIEHDGKRLNVMRSEMVDGELMGSMEIKAVRVVSNIRTVPERGGVVTLDFVVTIPKELLGRSRNVKITPQLHDEGGSKSLEDLIIRGALIDKIQQRDYWQYETYLSRYSPNDEDAQRMYNRFVKFPRPRDARLDSLVENSGHITYYYSQSIKSDETSKRMAVTLNGCVEGADNTIYKMPPSDTIRYSITSMLSFLDLSPRFKIKIVDKYLTVSDRNYIQYPLGKSKIIDTLGDNRTELAKITALMREITEQDEFFVDTITLTAASSPEGSFALNNRLSEQRAKALKDYLGRSSERLISVKWIAEDWEALREMILQDTQVVNRMHILKIIDSTKSLDQREALIRGRYPADYSYIRKELYPLLRGVNFKYNLRRKGMVKDTIHTTELDTVYAHGVRLLQQRQYPKALYLLDSYNDRNTIIALISMGHDKRALELLDTQPKDATTHYLRAIVLARLQRVEEAVSAFKEACKLEPRMEYRANLDPEITKLLKR